MAKGTVTLKTPATQAVERVKITLPFSSNWHSKN